MYEIEVVNIFKKMKLFLVFWVFYDKCNFCIFKLVSEILRKFKFILIMI